MCVVPVQATARTVPTPPLTRLWLDGILLCEAHDRCRDLNNGESMHHLIGDVIAIFSAHSQVSIKVWRGND
jgi:hypothetical protein